MNTTVTAQVPTDTLLQLIEKLRRRGGSQDISAAMTKAIECWLEDPAGFAPGADPEDVHGYQWKSLFRPEGGPRRRPRPQLASHRATPIASPDLPERRKFRYRLEDVAY